jgi:AcrR family transcriptional regulator
MGGTPATGMRARKKQRTHDDLIRIATDLFARHGYDAVTVEDIAAAADVSQRTFYRYFSSKEDLVLGDVNEDIASFAEALAHRSREEPVLESIRAVVLEAAIEYEQSYDANQARSALVAHTPGLKLREAERQAFVEEAITPLIAERLGVDANADMRPRLIAACAVTALRVASSIWLASGTAGSLSPTVDEALTLLTRGFGVGVPASEDSTTAVAPR